MELSEIQVSNLYPGLGASVFLLPWANSLNVCPWIASLGQSRNPEILELQSRVDLLGRELGKTMLQLPLAGDQCFPVETIENSLKASMEAARPFLFFDESRLKKYGNKHLNLIKMAHLADALSIPELNIPGPQGISTGQVFAFLQKQAPEVFSRWNDLKTLRKAFQGQLPFLQSSDAQNALLEIDSAIGKAFSAPDASTELGLSPAMLAWLAEREKKGEFLMVRSTGAEDSKEAANAGGNLSKAYVPPTPASLTSAIGDVVRSYFGATSLQNRLNAGLNPFEEELSLAVTAQQLIGEPVGGAKEHSKIPTSFVLFTNEPLYIGNEKFRAMRLSATYGHGESVVGNNGVATDTVLILRSESEPDRLYYLYNNKRKPIRLAPLKKGENVSLEKIPNLKELEEKPALSQKQILDIYRSGILMESFFDSPTDIEGVVLEDQVHFVQARPVNRKPMLPTYLAAPENQGVTAKSDAETLVVGEGSVVVVKTAEEVLFAPTLKEAERRYLAKQHKLVIVEESEPENSHPIVNFSNLAVPCLYASDADAVRGILAKIDAEHPIAACMQSGGVTLWDSKAAPLEKHIVEGFAVHPAKIAVSIPVPDGLSVGEGNSKIPDELLMRIRSGKNGLSALDELERHSELVSLRSQRGSFLSQDMSKAPQAIRDRLAVLERLDEQISRAIEEMRAVLKKNPEERLNRLLHAKTLETLLKRSGTQSSLGIYRLSDAEPLCRSIQILMEYQQKLKFPSHCIDFVLDGKAAPLAFPEWQQFLMEIDPLIETGAISKEKWGEFRDLVGALRKTGALPFWLTFFQREAKSPFAQERLEDILNQVSAQDRKFMEETLDLQQSIRQLKSGIDRFADPKSFPGAAKEYANLKQIGENAVKAASPIARSMFYRVMEEKIALLDTAAKTLKASRTFTPQDKTSLFKELLQTYYSMMRGLAETHVPAGAIPMHVSWPMNTYLSRIQELLDRLQTDDPAQLMPSPGFSVSAAMLGAQTAFERHEPQTLEDMLTLLHQNSLACLNALNQRLLSPEQIERSFLPQAVKEAMALVEKSEWGRSAQRLSIEITKNEIVVRYNVPLNNHSGHLDFRYDMATDKMVLTGQLLGQARNRWRETADWIAMLQEVGLYAPERPISETEQELTFHWQLKPGEFAEALKEYNEMAEYSLRERNNLLNPFSRFKDKPELLEKLIRNYLSSSLLDSESSFRFATQWVKSGRSDLHRCAEIAQASFAREDPKVSVTALLLLFRAMFDKGQGFEAAIEAAKTAAASANSLVQSRALELFKALVEKGQGFEAAIEAAKAAAASADYGTLDGALELFKALVDKGQGFEAAIEAAKPAAASAVAHVRRNARELFQALLDKGQGFEAAIEVAKTFVVSADYQTFLDALVLFNALVEKGQGFEAAIEAAKTAAASADVFVRRDALRLLKVLVDKGQGFEAAIEAAKTAAASADVSVRTVAIGLFKALLDKGQEFEKDSSQPSRL